MSKNIVRCLSTFKNSKEESIRTCVSFHPSELILAVGSGRDVKLWTFSSHSFEATCLLPISMNISVNSVAFHPSKKNPPVFVTGLKDNTVRIWQVEPDGGNAQLDANCVTNLGTGQFEARDLEIHKHTSSVSCAVFHPMAPLLVTGSNIVKLWMLNEDGSISKWLEDIAIRHYDYFNINYISLAFHSREPLLAIGSGTHDVNRVRSSAGAIEIRRLSTDGSKTHVTTTLDDLNDNCVKTVAFHPIANPPVLAAAFNSNQVKLWRFNPDASSATAILTLDEEHKPRYYSQYTINCISFHPLLPILATGSNYGTIKIWRLNFETSHAICLLTLDETNGGHNRSIESLAFHPSPSMPFLASSSFDNTAKLWDCSSFLEQTSLLKTSNAFSGLTSLLVKRLAKENHHKNQSGSIVHRVASHVMDMPWSSKFPFYHHFTRRIHNLSRRVLPDFVVSPLNPWKRGRLMLKNSEKKTDSSVSSPNSSPRSSPKSPKKGGRDKKPKYSRRFKSVKKTLRKMRRRYILQ